ncbi:hypothetical protein L6164_012767 [Bauhinia variegata]|uniref:Uncharacterized protein n=1 Tax=Bauhinia variegata TaxID=167791 RepID=A0ACB9PB13_BAUVA|nr:hypothetical protein L6164_012767 [Bauhinia variegata]
MGFGFYVTGNLRLDVRQIESFGDLYDVCQNAETVSGQHWFPSSGRKPWLQGSRGQQQHPYHFSSRSFQTFYTSELGHIRALPRFDSFNRLLRGLQNYRILDFQSRPQTFFVPHHSNAHYVFIVLRGKALFTFVTANSRESYNLERADVLVVPAGSTVYAANRDNRRNLRVVQLAIPVNNPEQFQAPYQEIQRDLLGQQGQQQQGQGLIVKASRDQIRQLAQQARSSQGQSQFTPFNLEKYETPISNDYGKMWEARPYQLPQLQYVDVSLAKVELRPGAMILPHYNTVKTPILYIVQGNATIETASPHLSRQKSHGGSGCGCQEEQEQEEQQWRVGQIQSLTAQVNEGDVYVIPPGHPTAIRASNNGNLHFVSFGINDENNKMTLLAGENDNAINQIDSVAKELTFSGSAEQVERILKNQRQSYIVNGQPQKKQGQGSEGGLRAPLS